MLCVLISWMLTHGKGCMVTMLECFKLNNRIFKSYYSATKISIYMYIILFTQKDWVKKFQSLVLFTIGENDDKRLKLFDSIFITNDVECWKSTGCPTKNYTLFWGAVASSKLGLFSNVRGVSESSRPKLSNEYWNFVIT